MNKLVVAFTFVVVSSISVFAQPACERHTETAGGFSYCPPVGWTSTLDNSKRFLKFSAPRPTVANFNVKDEASTATLAAYTDSTIKDMTTPKPGGVVKVTKLVNRSDIQTASRMREVRLVFQYELQGYQLQAIGYIFNGKAGKKLALVATMLATDTETPKVMDDMVRTLRLEP